MNRKERRAGHAKARKNKKRNPSPLTEGNVEERLHDAIHEAVAKVLKGVDAADVPHQKIIRGLGLTAAAFAVQLAASLAADPSEVPTLITEGRSEFLKGMGGYYDGVAKALGVEIGQEPAGPTLVLP